MIRVCPHSDSACPHGMGCTFSCATDAYDGEKRPAASPADGLVTIPPNLTAAAPRAPTGRVWSGAIGSGPADRSAMPRADQEYIAELQSKLTALVEAGKPFAEAYAFWCEAEGPPLDSVEIDDQGKITMGRLRALALVLSEVEQGNQELSSSSVARVDMTPPSGASAETEGPR